LASALHAPLTQLPAALLLLMLLLPRAGGGAVRRACRQQAAEHSNSEGHAEAMQGEGQLQDVATVISVKLTATKSEIPCILFGPILA
jgi:hypothetical protein